jgi:protoporphyrinogen IX oxidase
MEGWLAGAYLWVKAGHVIFVIFWMAGLFMLPRFYAYHAEDIARQGVGGALDLEWRSREARLMTIILNPAMIVSWVFGIALALHLGFAGNIWLHVKLLVVLLLSGYHGYMAALRKSFIRGANAKSGKFFRIMNEVPSFAAIVTVILVIVQPF